MGERAGSIKRFMLKYFHKTAQHNKARDLKERRRRRRRGLNLQLTPNGGKQHRLLLDSLPQI